jgi:hypothetical protein
MVQWSTSPIAIGCNFYCGQAAAAGIVMVRSLKRQFAACLRIGAGMARFNRIASAIHSSMAPVAF